MIILIDDDRLIRLGWELKAQKVGLELNTFESFDSFLKIHKSFNLCTQIYIDSDLQNGLKGEICAKKIKDLGFNEIYLTTGYCHLKIENYPWLKGILSKSPPF